MPLMFSPKGLSTASKVKAAIAILSGIICLTPFVMPFKGEVISFSVLLWYLTIAFGAYGLQFLLAPALLIDQNFDVKPDKYHLFIARTLTITACLISCPL